MNYGLAHAEVKDWIKKRAAPGAGAARLEKLQSPQAE